MDIKKQTQLHFNGVDIVNIQFQSNEPYNRSQEINLEIEAKVYYPREQPDTFSIFMTITLTRESIFNLSVTGIGHFTLDSEAEEGLRKAFVNLNAPAIMFPYMRSFISTLTANVGNSTGMLTIPPHFFKGQLEEIQKD